MLVRNLCSPILETDRIAGSRGGSAVSDGDRNALYALYEAHGPVIKLCRDDSPMPHGKISITTRSTTTDARPATTHQREKDCRKETSADTTAKRSLVRATAFVHRPGRAGVAFVRGCQGGRGYGGVQVPG
jgi:hypothetical protein